MDKPSRGVTVVLLIIQIYHKFYILLRKESIMEKRNILSQYDEMRKEINESKD